MKYEFIKNGIDDYSLKYKDKEIRFNSKVDIAKRMQESIEKGKTNLIFDLAKNGMTVKELCKEVKKDGKTYIDNSNYETLEKTYINNAQAGVFIEVLEELLKTTYTELMLDIGLTTEKEIEQFGLDFGNVINGSFPSKKES